MAGVVGSDLSKQAPTGGSDNTQPTDKAARERLEQLKRDPKILERAKRLGLGLE